MRAVIVSGAPGLRLDPDYFADESLFVAGADRGALKLLEKNIQLHLAIGDFDSVSLQEFASICEASREVVRLETEKDETDTEAALTYIIGKNIKDITLYGGLGGRLDHSISNIRLLLRFCRQGITIRLIEDGNLVMVLCPGDYQFPSNGYPYLSFFSMGADVEGLTLKNVKYPLENASLSQEDTICTSNEPLEDFFSVSFNSGYLMMVQSRDVGI